MSNWLKISGRRRCREVVLRPKGRRHTLYLVPCGRPASWKPRKTAFSHMTFCDGHKKFMELRVKAAKDVVRKMFPT